MKSTYKQRISIEAVYDGESNRRIFFAQFLYVLPQDSSELLQGSFPLSVHEYHIDNLHTLLKLYKIYDITMIVAIQYIHLIMA